MDEILFSRRTALKVAALGSLGVMAAPTLTSCAAIGAVPLLPQGWLATMTASLAAGALVSFFEPLRDAFYEWEPGRQAAVGSESAAGHEFFSEFCYGDMIPPATMFSSSLTSQADSQTDRFIVCVNGGSETVAFEPWAWQGLYKYVEEITKDQSGKRLGEAQSLCKASLIPSATIDQQQMEMPSGMSEMLWYHTRNGIVELGRWTDDETGATNVQVSAEGIRNVDGVRRAPIYVVPAA